MDNDFKLLVEKRLNDWFEIEKRQAQTHETKLLLERIQAVVLRGGKRLRPLLLKMTYSAYAGNNDSQLIDLAAALELHHQFLLIHDDIIDKDSFRYSEPNIIGLYQKDYHSKIQNIPEAMALLTGDLLFTFTNQLILSSKYYSHDQKIELLGLLMDTNRAVIYGQQLDSFNIYDESPQIGLDRLELIGALKTAAYSTSLPMRSAGALINLSKSERQKIDEFALPFGVLFQLVNDYSDYFDNGSIFNNSSKYRDLRQGKITYPLYIALKRASGDDLVCLKKVLGNKMLVNRDINKVLSILDKYGARQESINYLEPYFVSTLKALNKLKIGLVSRNQFVKLVQSYRV